MMVPLFSRFPHPPDPSGDVAQTSVACGHFGGLDALLAKPNFTAAVVVVLDAFTWASAFFWGVALSNQRDPVGFLKHDFKLWFNGFRWFEMEIKYYQ